MSTLTDVDIARQLAKLWNNRFAKTESGWYEHKTGVWEPCTADYVHVQVSEWIYENLDASDPKVINNLRSTRKTQMVLSNLSGRLGAQMNEFDADPNLLNCPNGVVDLRTGQTRPHSQTDRFMLQTAAPYEPDIDQSMWIKALQAINPDAREWAQLTFGAAIFGRQSPYPRLTILRGGGSNGKSTIIDGIKGAIGDGYGKSFNPDAITAGTNNPEYEMARIKGARVLLSEELDDLMLGTAIVRRLTDSGSVTARFPYGRVFEFPLTHDLFLSTNENIRVASQKYGTARRFAMVEFPYKYVDEPLDPRYELKKDPEVRAYLRSAPRPEVLAWLVEGAMKVHRDQYALAPARFPESVRRDTQSWLDSQNTAQEFVTLHLERDEESYVLNKDLLSAYNSYREEQGSRYKIGTPKMFDEMRETSIADLIPKNVKDQPTRGARGERDRALVGVRLTYSNLPTSF